MNNPQCFHDKVRNEKKFTRQTGNPLECVPSTGKHTHIYNTQYLLSICIYTHRLVLKHQRLHCSLPLVHTNREDTIEDVKSLSACWAQLLMSIQGYGKVLDVLWSFPAFLIITNCSHSPPEHDPYPVWHIFRKAVPFLTIIHGSDMVRSVRTWKITGLDVEDLHSFTKWLWVNPDLNECFWFCSRCGLLVSVRHRAHKEWEGWNGPFPLLIQGHHWQPWKGPPQQQEGR